MAEAKSPFSVLRIVSLPVLAGAILLLETQRPFSLFRLATFALFFLLLADLTLLARGRPREILLVATSLVLGLTLIEAVVDIIAPAPVLTTARGFTVRVPVMGWGPAHAGRFRAKKIDAKTGRTIYDVVYSIAPDLLRVTRSCETCATIAFFGDSFTFGEGLNDTDTLPQAFANALDRKMRVVNLGFSGYGPQQFLREEETGRFDKVIGAQPELFVFLTAPWHAQRTSCKADWVLYGPRYVLSDNKVVYRGPCAQGPALWWRQWAAHIAPYRMFIEPDLDRINHADMELYIRILLAATQLAKTKYGVPTLIPYMRVPENYLRPTGFTNDEIINRLEEGGAFVVDVSLAREATSGAKLDISGDGHPTGLANRLRAAVLKAYIAQHFPQLLALKPQQASEAPRLMRE